MFIKTRLPDNAQLPSALPTGTTSASHRNSVEENGRMAKKHAVFRVGSWRVRVMARLAPGALWASTGTVEQPSVQRDGKSRTRWKPFSGYHHRPPKLRSLDVYLITTWHCIVSHRNPTEVLSEGSTMKRKTKAGEKRPTQQIAVRLDADLLSRLDAIAANLSRPGLELTRTDAIRIALLTGAQAIEKER